MTMDRYTLLGRSGLRVSPLALGTMTFGTEWNWGADEATARRLFDIYVNAGGNFIDTADLYTEGTSERWLGKFVAERGLRDKLVIATKYSYNAEPGNPNAGGNHRKNLMRALDASLARLGTDYIDLYYQHRVDPNTPIEDTVGELARLVAEGKVRFLGLSEAGTATIRRAHAVHPIAALQTEYSLWARDPEAELLPLLRELGIGFVPYSPLGHGFLTGDIRSPSDLSDDDWRKTNPRFTGENFQKNLRIVDEVKAVADEVGVTSAQVALAWLLAQGSDIAPIPGTKRVARVEENSAADGIELSIEQIAQLSRLTPAAGERHDEGNMAVVDR